MPALYLNDVDVATLGFRVEGLSGLLGTMSRMQLPTIEIPGLAGSLAATSRPKVTNRLVTVSLLLARQPTLLAMEQAMVRLAALAGAGRVQLRDGRDPSKVTEGVLVNGDELVRGPGLVPPLSSGIPLLFECDPYRRDVGGSITYFDAAPAATLAGTAPTDPRFYVGPGTNPSIKLRSLAGELLAVMGFTLVLAAGDFLTVDCAGKAITKSVSGTVSDAYSTWTTKGDGMLALDPHDGNPASSEGPTLEVTGTGGTPVAEAHYYRRYR